MHRNCVKRPNPDDRHTLIWIAPLKRYRYEKILKTKPSEGRDWDCTIIIDLEILNRR